MDKNFTQNEVVHQPTYNSYGVDYTIYGADMQFVEMGLLPESMVVGETGSMMYMDQGVVMKTRIGDGSKKHSGIFGSLWGAAKRSFAGENLFMTFFTNKSSVKATIAFAAPYPGMIIPLDLSKLGTSVYCQKEGFLCGTSGVSIGMGFTKRISAAMFGGEGYVLQKIEGDGIAFVHSGGAIMQRKLEAGQSMFVDTGSLVAFQSTVDFEISMVKGFSNMIFGGEDLFLTKLTGPGYVWVQSMPYPRLVLNIRNTIIDMNKQKKYRKK